jgi:hypothetical protein
MTGNVSLVTITVGRSWLARTVEEVEEAAGAVEEVVEMAFEEAIEEVGMLRKTLADPQQAATLPSPVRARKPRLIRTY